MIVITSPDEMTRYADSARQSRERIALVPTMGFLHDGHLALMREGRRESSVLVASIFVNPTQFGPGEDFARYPRNFERDCARSSRQCRWTWSSRRRPPRCARPTRSSVNAGEITTGLCGAHRPGHFRGVTTIVAKLFNIVNGIGGFRRKGFSATSRDPEDGPRPELQRRDYSGADCARKRRPRDPLAQRLSLANRTRRRAGAKPRDSRRQRQASHGPMPCRRNSVRGNPRPQAHEGSRN